MKYLIAGFVGLILFVASFAARAEDDPEIKAEEIHKIANSDIIYTQEEPKALYYQNVKIISLLKEIRDLLERQASRETRT